MIERMLAEARSRVWRSTAVEAASDDALIVDLRSNDERERDGIIPGSVHVPRSVLEWRCDPSSGFANEHLAGRRLLLVCAHGYSSSLAAASVAQLGRDVGDLEGGFEAWRAAGLPVAPAPERAEGLPGMEGPQ